MIFDEFIIGDVEDPELYAAHPLWQWQQTDKGRWVIEHCIDPKYEVIPDPHNYGYKIVIYGNLTKQDTTYFTLKYK